MKSVRTKIKYTNATTFKTFLDSIELSEVIIGDYETMPNNSTTRYICYAYSEKSDEVVAILTHITLKYGNIDIAYKHFLNAVMNSHTNDPYFNWIP